MLDVLYAPWPTPLATTGAAAGGTVVGGIEVLFWQATVQVELMTGQAAPLAAMRAALDAAVARTLTRGVTRTGPARGAADAAPRIARMLRWLTAGESHGQQLTAILEGLPAGVEVQTADSTASWPAAGSATAAARGCPSSRTRSRSPAACGTGAPRAARSPSRSATPSGPSGRR